MKKFTVEFKYEKSTKNTHRFQEIEGDMPARIGTIYVQKWAIGKNPPEKIVVTIEWEEETKETPKNDKNNV